MLSYLECLIDINTHFSQFQTYFYDFSTEKL